MGVGAFAPLGGRVAVVGGALEGEGKKEAEEKMNPEVGIKLGGTGRLKEGKAEAAGILAASRAGVGAGAAATNVVQAARRIDATITSGLDPAIIFG